MAFEQIQCYGGRNTASGHCTIMRTKDTFIIRMSKHDNKQYGEKPKALLFWDKEKDAIGWRFCGLEEKGAANVDYHPGAIIRLPIPFVVEHLKGRDLRGMYKVHGAPDMHYLLLKENLA